MSGSWTGFAGTALYLDTMVFYALLRGLEPAVCELFARIEAGEIRATFQFYVPLEMQGRVLTLLVSAILTIAPLRLAIGGPLADALGMRILFVVGGVGCLAIALVWALNPTIMYPEDRICFISECL